MIRRDKAIKFMRQADFTAKEFSKDQSTKVGMVVLAPDDYSVLTQGYNGIPRGVNDRMEERHQRPLKYDFFEHAERNGIFNLMRTVLKGSMLVSTVAPTIGCVRAIVSVGTKFAYFPRWEDPAVEKVALQLLTEAGVKTVLFEDLETSADSRTALKVRQYARRLVLTAEIQSKDPYGSAALFLTPDDFTPLSEGFSGMPRGADDEKIERYSEPLRARWVETAVRNAVYNGARRFLKGTAAIVTATTCIECARALASCGVSDIVYLEPTEDFVSRWGASITEAVEMLEELNVSVMELKRDEVLLT